MNSTKENMRENISLCEMIAIAIEKEVLDI